MTSLLSEQAIERIQHLYGEPSRPRTALAEAWAGRLPAEALDRSDREALIRALIGLRWSLTDTATHTRTTTYTLCRWLDLYELRTHQPRRKEVAA